VATRGDLSDRSMPIRLDPIPEERRRPEREISAEFEIARPRILGVLLDAVAHGLRHLATTQLDRLPRMADFAAWATACEGVIWEPGAFLDAYRENRAETDETVIEADLVAMAVRSLMVDLPSWAGTAKELLSKLAAIAGEPAAKMKSWPTAPRALSGRLRRAAPNLRRIGISIVFEERQAKGRPISITAERRSVRPSRPSSPSSAQVSAGLEDDGRVTGDAATVIHTVTRNPVKSAGDDGRDGNDGCMRPLSGGDEETAEWTL